MMNWLSRLLSLAAFARNWLNCWSVSAMPKSYQELIWRLGTSKRSSGLMYPNWSHHGSPGACETKSSQSVGGPPAFFIMSTRGRLVQIGPESAVGGGVGGVSHKPPRG